MPTCDNFRPTSHGGWQSILPLRLHHNLLDAVNPGPDAALLPVLPRGVEQAVGGEEHEDSLGHDLEEHDDHLAERRQVPRVAARVVRGVQLRAVRPRAQEAAPHLTVR